MPQPSQLITVAVAEHELVPSVKSFAQVLGCKAYTHSSVITDPYIFKLNNSYLCVCTRANSPNGIDQSPIQENQETACIQHWQIWSNDETYNHHPELSPYIQKNAPPLYLSHIENLKPSSLGLDMAVLLTPSFQTFAKALEALPELKRKKIIELDNSNLSNNRSSSEKQTENKRLLGLFDIAGITLELSQTNDKQGTHFWGMGFITSDIQAEHQRLSNTGVKVSNIRKGMKKNTQVASIKSHLAGIPCLLTERCL